MITYVQPKSSMDQLSQNETESLQKTAGGELSDLLTKCCLAVLNSGNITDSPESLLSSSKDFAVEVIQKERGIKLKLYNPPETAFVNGNIIKGIEEHLFSVLRDIVYIKSQSQMYRTLDLTNSNTITNWIFYILRNAKLFQTGVEPNVVVCWGGHSICKEEYNYTKEVGQALGLYKLDICTGCGPGAMEGPMSGAAVGHIMQRYDKGRFIGITEPSIISAEPPNPLVTQLIIMPDIEKRLESFVRIGHAFVIFPGGPGTLEELMFILGIKMNSANADQPIPVVLTGPKSSEKYFEQLDHFIRTTLGENVARQYDIVIDDPEKVADICYSEIQQVTKRRITLGDSFNFNWKVQIDHIFQEHFYATHENMRSLNLTKDQPLNILIANLRNVFSGIVSGNVKPKYIKLIQEKGPYELHGEPEMISNIDKLLKYFIEQGRMKLDTSQYAPCYKIVQ
ncbi:MAG: nucleotide 5'-monophosphate nucleosidase PpnN [Succinivibrionaceae bacterium]|nr:nucleotide 5'-monophosphate nucleosidase PpnN [Succinivibrionaceae bacterium]